MLRGSGEPNSTIMQPEWVGLRMCYKKTYYTSVEEGDRLVIIPTSEGGGHAACNAA